MKQTISSPAAPAALGCYSQAIKVGSMVYLSGQIGLDPASMALVSSDVAQQAHQAFTNLAQVAAAAGGSLDHIVKLTLFLVSMADFAVCNEVMASFFIEPYPARSCVAVKELPKQAKFEVEAIMALT